MKPTKPKYCEFCRRQIKLTFHHLVPKKKQRDRRLRQEFVDIDLIHYGIWLCKPCHTHLHKKFTHEELAFHLNTKERLLKNENVSSFVAWAKKQTKRIK